MTYQDYIELGFNRIDTSDVVLFRQTGYYGYYLEYRLAKNITIEMYQDELNTPKLYIKYGNDEFLKLPIEPGVIPELIESFK